MPVEQFCWIFCIQFTWLEVLFYWNIVQNYTHVSQFELSVPLVNLIKRTTPSCSVSALSPRVRSEENTLPSRTWALSTCTTRPEVFFTLTCCWGVNFAKAASVGARMMRGFAGKGMELKDIDAWVVLMQHSKNIWWAIMSNNHNLPSYLTSMSCLEFEPRICAQNIYFPLFSSFLSKLFFLLLITHPLSSSTYRWKWNTYFTVNMFGFFLQNYFRQPAQWNII